MTVALGDAALLCGMLRPLPDLGNAAATAQATASFYSRRTPLSTTINTLANALYQVPSRQLLGRSAVMLDLKCWPLLAPDACPGTEPGYHQHCTAPGMLRESSDLHSSWCAKAQRSSQHHLGCRPASSPDFTAADRTCPHHLLT